MAHLHKKFTDHQVKDLLKRYLNSEIERPYIQQILGIGKTRFFALIKKYQSSPSSFSIQYERKTKSRTVPKAVEDNILKELTIEKTLIEDPEVPLRSYNYSYIKDRLAKEYHQTVSLPTIIDRAKKNNFYLKKPKKTRHDREVLTNYAGELIQHDSSHHLWSPPAHEKWYLITSLDDFSRFILYATLLKRETSWDHILALQSVALKYGLPYSYYVDCHSIFRFVQGRDSNWRTHHLLTDEVDPQWKQVMNDCNIKILYALSPQAKGKIERPYGWLQDRLIRTCVRENVTDISHAQRVLNQEIKRYNYHQVHSTTHEVPYYRLKEALRENKSLFREFVIQPPFQSVKDIFCLRLNRRVDAYRRISINNEFFKVKNSTPHETVTLRIYPLNAQISEVRFWYNNRLIDVQKVKNSVLKEFTFNS
jgi:L-rhamnose mutarotase